jgi:SAM-dependent methyltransferase
VTPEERWLEAMWPVVRARLPAPPARVLEVGCGRLGGFVPVLLSNGYEAVGVDREAPDGADYRGVDFEELEPRGDVDAVLASRSLHHVGDAGEVVDHVARALAPGGTLVVIEWNWEAFDEPTAEWCFQRLRPEDEGWLQRQRERWIGSGRPWGVAMREWAEGEHLHPVDALVRLLDERFRREHLAEGPYFFTELAEVSEADELEAIQAGQIRATRVDYVGILR